MGVDFKVQPFLGSDKERLFLSIFGTNTVHVKSPVAEVVQLMGIEEPQLVYWLDFDLLKPEQYNQLVRYTMQRFGATEEEVQAKFASEGMPLRVSELILTVENPMKWLGDEFASSILWDRDEDEEDEE